MPPSIISSGGYIPPTTGASGHIVSPQNIPYHAGRTGIGNIPEFQRDYNLRDQLATLIKEGRSNMAKMALAYARKNGAYVVSDVEHQWYLEHTPIPRIYLDSAVQGAASSGYYKFSFKPATDGSSRHNDVKRVQVNDYLALMCSFVDRKRTSKPQASKFTSTALTHPLPEILKVVNVNYDKGYFLAERNVAGDLRGTANPTTPDSFTVGTAEGNVVPESAFVLKMGNVLSEGMDDQKIWSYTNTKDYNYCQYMMRKWGATDIEQNIKKKGQNENSLVRNRRIALDEFYGELDYQFLFGVRNTGFDEKGKWWGSFGGLMEFVPDAHYISVEAPLYDSDDMNDFTTPRFNTLLEDKFYYGSQNKIMLCGANFHKAFATMINKQTQAVATILDEWSVKGRRFEASNGGTVDFVPSDTMTLNGLADYGILWDPSTVKYGHLENMDINIIEKLSSENPHIDTGEIFGVLTTKRENPDANWVFALR